MRFPLSLRFRNHRTSCNTRLCLIPILPVLPNAKTSARFFRKWPNSSTLDRIRPKN